MKLLFYIICITFLRSFANASNLELEQVMSEDELEFYEIKEWLRLQEPRTFERSVASWIMCTGCRKGVKIMTKLHKRGISGEKLTKIATIFCKILTSYTEEVCKGIMQLNLPILTYIVDHEPAFNEKTFCGIILQSDNRELCTFNDPRFEWEIDIPPKPANITKKLSISKDNKKIKILHLTDIHYDQKYDPNAVANCAAPTCCRKGQTAKFLPTLMQENISEDGKSTQENYNNSITKRIFKKTIKAGYWGYDNLCDTPWWTFKDAINHITETHKDIDIIYHTGDIMDHGIWETTKEQVTTTINDTLNLLKESFGDIPVYSVVGNHESQPLNEFADSRYVTDPELSTSWLYELLAEKWSIWLSKDTKETIKIGGYYTALVKPGFRIIALNNNLCYIYNWWIHLTPNDNSGQLKWLVKVLTEAEKNSEKVHILAHVPAGTTDSFHTCTREYRKIIDRFADTITAEFNGHTHMDEFKVFYNKNREPHLIGWNGGSLTAHSTLNMNYKVFEIDSATMEVTNNEVWACDLEEANLNPDKRPNWYKEYDFKEAYNVTYLEPKSIHELLVRMVTTEKHLLKNSYHNFRWKSSKKAKECDKTCIKSNLCYMTTTEVYDDKICNEFIDKYYQN